MFGRATVLAVIMLSLVFTGCIGNKGDNTPPTDQKLNTTSLPANATVAPDGRGSISAFNETNKTETKGIGAMMHTHDYWKGKERLDVGYIDAGLIPFPLAPCKRADGACTAGATTPAIDPSTGDTYPVGTAIADFLMTPTRDDSRLIPEGTQKVELKLSKLTGPTVQDPAVAPANPTGHVYFDYLASNDEPGKFRKGGELKLGTATTIEIKPTDSDMPHQTASLWIWRIYSDSNMGWFEFNITITAVKGYDVVNWPPHPDLYAEHKDRAVFDGPVKLASKGTVDANLWGSDAGWIHPQKVISWGTDSIDIEVTNVAFSSDTGAPVTPSGWVFEYNNASKPPLLGNGAQYSARLKDSASDGKSFHFTIDLTKDDGRAMDTPYGQFSRWGFRLVPQFDNNAVPCYDSPMPEGRFIQQFLVGCQFVPWSASYSMKIVGHGHSIADGIAASVV